MGQMTVSQRHPKDTNLASDSISASPSERTLGWRVWQLGQQRLVGRVSTTQRVEADAPVAQIHLGSQQSMTPLRTHPQNDDPAPAPDPARRSAARRSPCRAAAPADPVATARVRRGAAAPIRSASRPAPVPPARRADIKGPRPLMSRSGTGLRVDGHADIKGRGPFMSALQLLIQ